MKLYIMKLERVKSLIPLKLDVLMLYFVDLTLQNVLGTG